MTRSSLSEATASAASTPSSPSFWAQAPVPSFRRPATYEPSGRSCAREEIVRHNQGAKHEREPVWHAGPAGRTRSRIASPSQSSRSSSTASVFPDVSPLCQSCSRERLQNQASPVSRVRLSASSSIQASISTRPLSASWTIAARSSGCIAEGHAGGAQLAAKRREPVGVLVEDRGEQGRLRNRERLDDMLGPAGSAGGDDRDGDRLGDPRGQLEVV